jgi:DNA adenine methylase
MQRDGVNPSRCGNLQLTHLQGVRWSRAYPIDTIAGNDDDYLMRYPGGKGKCYQHVINILPPHQTYIETHLGGGSVLLKKKPAAFSIGIDRDPAVIRRWKEIVPTLAHYVEADAVDFLRSTRFFGDELIYCDPPYLPSTRRRNPVYRYDYCEADHINLLQTLQSLPCAVVISGYPSQIYDDCLSGWSKQTFMTRTRQGSREEKLWFNFATPNSLHDPRFLGRNFRERQTIKRRLERLQTRINGLSPREQSALISELIVARSPMPDSDLGPEDAAQRIGTFRNGGPQQLSLFAPGGLEPHHTSAVPATRKSVAQEDPGFTFGRCREAS